MVVPNRDLGNMHFLFSAFTTSTQMNPLPSALEMDIDSVDNYDNIRKRTHSSSNTSTRSASVVLQASSLPYYERMVINNDFSDKEIMEPIDSSQLSYSGDGQGKNHDSIVTDPILPQCASNEALAHNTYNGQCVGNNDIINIQLPYNPNQPMEPELWDSNFGRIFLHGSLEHLPSDASSIKTSFIHMAKYIKNKKIDIIKSNSVKELQGIGKAA